MFALGLLCSCVKWLVQLLSICELFYNSPLYRGSGYLALEAGYALEPPESFELPFEVNNSVFRGALAMFVLGMMLNVVVVARHLAFRSSNTLRRDLQARPASAVLALSFSALHPEVMSVAARRLCLPSLGRFAGRRRRCVGASGYVCVSVCRCACVRVSDSRSRTPRIVVHGRPLCNFMYRISYIYSVLFFSNTLTHLSQALSVYLLILSYYVAYNYTHSN